MQFLELLPRVETHARITFGFLRCRDLREDKIQESVALAWQWFLRLAEQGKDVNTFLVTFCRLLVRAVRAGRRVCGMHRSKDVLNPLAQRRFGFRVERLPASTRCSHDSLSSPVLRQKQHNAFEERLQDNTITPVVDQVIFRLDWPRFFRALSRRDRGLATFLSKGNTNKLASRKFRLSPGRVTQLRQQWCREWRTFQGDISDQPVLPPNPS
jgi:hypothetical protein